MIENADVLSQSIIPFTVAIPEEDILDLKQRLDLVRRPVK